MVTQGTACDIIFKLDFMVQMFHQKQTVFNSSMSKLRVAAEWEFYDVKSYFTSVKFSRKLRLSVTLAGTWYSCPIIVLNLKVGPYGRTVL
jgi:hypothetical protein